MKWITNVSYLGLAALLVLIVPVMCGDANSAAGNSTVSLRISDVCFVAPSPERANLNGEWVEIENFGSLEIDLSGWSLSDNQGHTYNFPAGFNLRANAKVKVHTGSGTDTQEDLYWGRSVPVWNNDGDTATLRDSSGNIIDKKP